MSKKKQISKKPGLAQRYGHLIPYVLIIVLILIIYKNVPDYTFHFDDETSINSNSTIRSLENFKSVETWLDVTERPASYFTFAINYHYSELDPKGYHWFNIFFHILTTILVYLLAKRIIGFSFKDLPDKGKIILAGGVALIFAAHTIQVMAVTYVAQRITILSALFYICSVLLYIKARQDHLKDGLKPQTYFMYFLTVLTAILAVLSKQNAASLPLMWWFAELYFIRGTNQKIAKKYLIIYGSIILVGFLAVLLMGKLPRESKEIERWSYLITQFKILVFYFQLLFFPRGFNIDHDVKISDSLFGTYELVGLAIIIILIFFAVRWFKKYPLLSFGIAWFFITMSIESTIIPITDLMFEHRIYLPFLGISLLVSTGIFLLLKQNTRKYSVVIIVITIILSAITINRNHDWETNTTIWESSLKNSPDSKRALVYVGREVVHSDPKRALKLFNRAISLDSTYYHGWLNRGIYFYEKGNYDKAVSDFNNAEDNSDKYHDYVFFMRGVSYVRKKDYERALPDFNKYINRTDHNVEAYIYRGEVLYYLKRYKAAADDYIKAVQMDPRRKQIYLNLIEVYYRLNDVEMMKYYIRIAQQNGLKVRRPYLEYVSKN